MLFIARRLFLIVFVSLLSNASIEFECNLKIHSDTLTELVHTVVYSLNQYLLSKLVA